MTLSEINKGARVKIISIPDDEIRAQAIRLGISEGAAAECLFRFERGPVLLNIGGQEIAIGNSLAEKIEVGLSQNKGQ